MKFLALFVIPAVALGSTIKSEPHTYEIDSVNQLKAGDSVGFKPGFTFHTHSKDGKLTADVGGCVFSIAPSSKVDQLRLTHDVHWKLQGDPVWNREDGTVKFTLYHFITSRTIAVDCDERASLESLTVGGINIPATRSYDVKIEELSAPASEAVERPADATIAI